jgi:hypothetical protein
MNSDRFTDSGYFKRAVFTDFSILLNQSSPNSDGLNLILKTDLNLPVLIPDLEGQSPKLDQILNLQPWIWFG